MDDLAIKILVQQCIDGDRDSQRVLYHTYKKDALKIAYRICGDYHFAKDIVSIGFCEVFKSLWTWQERSKLRTWILSVIKFTAIDFVRKHKRKNDGAIAAQTTTQPEIYAKFFRDDMMAKINSLADGYRKVLLLKMEGYTHLEIAEMLHITTGTSKKQLFYAQKILLTNVNQ